MRVAPTAANDPRTRLNTKASVNDSFARNSPYQRSESP